MRRHTLALFAIAFLLIVVLSIFIPGCTDPNAPLTYGNISGVVKDRNGRPVAVAGINMFYSSLVQPLSKSGTTLPTTSIAISIPHDGFLHVVAENYIHEHVREIFAESVAAGMIEVTWDFHNDAGRDLYTDCYWVDATLDGAPLGTKKMLAVTYQYDVPNPEPFLLTNSSGHFTIPYSRLPLNETFTRTDYTNGTNTEVRIGPTDEIFAFTPTAYGSASVTYTNPRELTIVLSQNK